MTTREFVVEDTVRATGEDRYGYSRPHRKVQPGNFATELAATDWQKSLSGIQDQTNKRLQFGCTKGIAGKYGSD